MDFLKQNKTMIIGAVVLLLGAYVYFTYFSGPPSSPTLTASDASITLSQNLLVTLQNLHTIQLDDSIFSEPAFISLNDFGVTIPLQSVGRSDPFLPLGSSATPASTPTTPALKLPSAH
jgi:hypothetical protein